MFLTVLSVTKNPTSLVNLSAAALFPSTFTRVLGNFNTCFIIIMMIPAPFPSHLLHLLNLYVCCCRYSILISSDNDDPRSHLIRDMNFAVQFAHFFFFNARGSLLTLANIKFSEFFQITNISKISRMLILVVLQYFIVLSLENHHLLYYTM